MILVMKRRVNIVGREIGILAIMMKRRRPSIRYLVEGMEGCFDVGFPVSGFVLKLQIPPAINFDI